MWQKVEIYGVQSPTIDVILNPSVMARAELRLRIFRVLSMRRIEWWMPEELMPV